MKEAGESLKEPKPIVFEDKDFQSKQGIKSLEFGVYVFVVVSYFLSTVFTSLIYFALFLDFPFELQEVNPAKNRRTNGSRMVGKRYSFLQIDFYSLEYGLLMRIYLLPNDIFNAYV